MSRVVASKILLVAGLLGNWSCVPEVTSSTASARKGQTQPKQPNSSPKPGEGQTDQTSGSPQDSQFFHSWDGGSLMGNQMFTIVPVE